MKRWGAVVAAVGVAFALATPGSAAADSLTPLCNGQACSDGWYTTPVTVTWAVDPATSNVSDCAEILPSDVDVTATTSCQANWGFGAASMSYTVHVELSSPTATASLSRPPDSNGWYTHPVTVTFSGSSFSGIASCTQPLSYSGQSVTGSCTDNAGKVASTSVSLNYDATPPTITGASASHVPNYNGWYTKPVSFTFTGTDSGSGIDRCQVVKYTGPVSGSVTGRCWDRAGNVATLTVPVAFLKVISRRSNVRISSAPVLLRWKSVRRASYYNVQLYRGNRKLLSRWPSSSSLFLSGSWRFAGRRFRLRRGHYHWYVWPGYGSRAADRYGRSNMSGTFTVT